MGFIELHYESGKPFNLNSANINKVLSTKDGRTCVTYADDRFSIVKETPSEVLELIAGKSVLEEKQNTSRYVVRTGTPTYVVCVKRGKFYEGNWAEEGDVFRAILPDKDTAVVYILDEMKNENEFENQGTLVSCIHDWETPTPEFIFAKRNDSGHFIGDDYLGIYPNVVGTRKRFWED